MVRMRVVNSCRIWSPTQLNTPHPVPATYCLYLLWCWEGRRGGAGKVRGTIVHKARSKIPTWLTVSQVYKLHKPIKMIFRFGVLIVNKSMEHAKIRSQPFTLGNRSLKLPRLFTQSMLHNVRRRSMAQSQTPALIVRFMAFRLQNFVPSICTFAWMLDCPIFFSKCTKHWLLFFAKRTSRVEVAAVGFAPLSNG